MNGENDEATGEEGSSWSSHTGLFIGVWLVALIAFLFLPCFVNKKLRRVCMRRIKERRWNVEMDSELDDSTWYVIARARYEAARLRADELVASRRTNGANSLLSEEEKEALRQEFLLEQLSKYSSKLADDDIKKKQGIEEGISKSLHQENETDLEMGNASSSEDGDAENDVGDVPALQLNGFEDSDTVVSILPGGVCIAAALDMNECQVQNREVPNGCAICLSSFSTGEVITWAANEKCAHAFHHECILNWLLAVGRKKRREQSESAEETPEDAIREALNFPMLCPCCRQTFVLAPQDTNSCVTHGETEEESSVEAASERSLPAEESNIHEITVSATA